MEARNFLAHKAWEKREKSFDNALQDFSTAGSSSSQTGNHAQNEEVQSRLQSHNEDEDIIESHSNEIGSLFSSVSPIGTDSVTSVNCRKMSLPSSSFSGQQLSSPQAEISKESDAVNYANVTGSVSSNVYSSSLDDAVLNGLQPSYRDRRFCRSLATSNISARRNSVGAVDDPNLKFDAETNENVGGKVIESTLQVGGMNRRFPGISHVSSITSRIHHQLPKNFSSFSTNASFKNFVGGGGRSIGALSKEGLGLSHGPLPTLPVNSKQLEPFLSALEAVKTARSGQSYEERPQQPHRYSGGFGPTEGYVLPNTELYTPTSENYLSTRTACSSKFDYRRSREFAKSLAQQNSPSSNGRLSSPGLTTYGASLGPSASTLNSFIPSTSGSNRDSASISSALDSSRSIDTTVVSVHRANEETTDADSNSTDSQTPRFPLESDSDRDSQLTQNTDSFQPSLDGHSWQETSSEKTDETSSETHNHLLKFPFVERVNEIDVNSLNGYENVGRVVDTASEVTTTNSSISANPSIDSSNLTSFQDEASEQLSESGDTDPKTGEKEEVAEGTENVEVT